MTNEANVLERLLVDNAQLRSENRYLRKVTKDSAHGRLLRRTHTDAQQLIVWRFAGFPISRPAAHEQGMTRRRWQWSRALLMLARVHNGEDIITCNFDEAISQLAATVAKLERDGLELLRLKLPISARKAGTPVGTALGSPAGTQLGNSRGQSVPAAREKADRVGTQTGKMRDRRAEVMQRHREVNA